MLRFWQRHGLAATQEAFDAFVVSRRTSPPGAVDTWPTGSPEQTTDLLVPYPSELMRAHRVSRRVNKPENDDPELMAPVELETEQQALQLN